MPRRYVQIPTQQPDDELEAVFDASDDEHDGAIVHRPLLSPAQRPPRESDDDERGGRDQSQQTSRAPQQPTIDGRYNFEYDYPPPPGSPPQERAEPSNTWGNSNGVIPDFSNPRIAPRPKTGWLFKTWRTLMGQRRPEQQQRVVGGGIQNDGVFGNISARPVPGNASRTPLESTEQDTVLHAPEFASSDAPPSYNLAQLDQPPSYWDNTVLATAPEDLLVGNLPVGSLFAFLWSFLLSFSLQWIGFAIAWMLSTSHAGRFGARAGLGVALVQLGLTFRQRADEMNNNNVVPWPLPEDGSVTDALPAQTGDVTNSTVSDYSDSAVFTYQTIALNEWVAMILMTAGWFLFMTSLLGYWRVKRWESSIRASQPRAPQTPEPSAEEQQAVFVQLGNLERNLGWRFVVTHGLGFRRGMGMFTPHGRPSEDDITLDVDELIERGENERRRVSEDEIAEDPEEQAFRRNLRTIGLV